MVMGLFVMVRMGMIMGAVVFGMFMPVVIRLSVMGVRVTVFMVMVMRMFVVAFHDSLLLVWHFKIQLPVELFHINLSICIIYIILGRIIVIKWQCNIRPATRAR